MTFRNESLAEQLVFTFAFIYLFICFGFFFFCLLRARWWCINLRVKSRWGLVAWNVPCPGHSVPSSLPVTQQESSCGQSDRASHSAHSLVLQSLQSSSSKGSEGGGWVGMWGLKSVNAWLLENCSTETLRTWMLSPVEGKSIGWGAGG